MDVLLSGDHHLEWICLYTGNEAQNNENDRAANREKILT
jgi:desulfoferrodoxin (superoxide reductase-like protein)